MSTQNSPQVYKNVATPVVHSSPQVAMEIDQLDKHNNFGIDSTLPDVHVSSQNGVEFVQSDQHSKLQTDKVFEQVDRYSSSQVGMDLDQPDMDNTLMTSAQMPPSTDTCNHVRSMFYVFFKLCKGREQVLIL